MSIPNSFKRTETAKREHEVPTSLIWNRFLGSAYFPPYYPYCNQFNFPPPVPFYFNQVAQTNSSERLVKIVSKEKKDAAGEISLCRLSCFQNYDRYRIQVKKATEKQAESSVALLKHRKILDDAKIAYLLLSIPRKQLTEKFRRSKNSSNRQMLFRGILNKDPEILNLAIKKLMYLQILAQECNSE
jgi:hypothetical protein